MARITLSSSSNLVPHSASFNGPKKMEIWRRQIRTIGGMGEYSPSKFGDCLLGSQTRVRVGTVVLIQHASCIPVRPHSLVTLFQFLEGFDVCIRIDCLTSGHHIHHNHPPMSQKTVIMSFPVEGVILNFFFLGECGWCHSTDCFFISGSQWWAQVLSPVTIQDKRPPPQHQNAPTIQNRWLSSDVCAWSWDFEEPILRTPSNIPKHQ